jgi:hypothetical protein
VTRLVTLLLTALAAGALLAFAWGSGHRARSPVAALTAAHAQGKIGLRNSRRGKPIVSMARLAPGKVAHGSVLMGNSGTKGVHVSLEADNLSGAPGALGGNLSQALWIKIHGVRRNSRGTGSYRGPLALMGTLSVGHWHPGESRRFTFTAWLPDSGTPPGPTSGDNVYQGATASVDFRWTVRP